MMENVKTTARVTCISNPSKIRQHSMDQVRSVNTHFLMHVLVYHLLTILDYLVLHLHFTFRGYSRS